MLLLACCLSLAAVGATAGNPAVGAAAGNPPHGHRRGPGHSGPQADKPKQPITITPSGEIRGAYNVTRRGRQFESYRGIRYAEPPVGELRFQAPKLIHQYKSPVDASEEGPACPMPVPDGYHVDEDCLAINVYTPLKSERTKLLPVIMFIHAGGFYSMSGRSDLAGPHYLLDRDVVLVTINYRLGSLGFISTGDELAPGNNGFKDQVAALRWVQRNIAAFGGDPRCVTIAGCSAGSISVMLHMISPMSKGLFHRAISMSGSPISTVPSPTEQRHLAVKQAQLLNCSTESSKAIIDCLKTKPWRALGDSLPEFAEFAYDPILIWAAVVEPDFGQERFLTMDPVEAIKKGEMHAVPYIVSQTEDEFFWVAYNILENDTLIKQINTEWNRVAPIPFLLPRENNEDALKQLRKAYFNDKPVANDTESGDNLGKLYADSIIGFPVHRLVNLMCRHSPQPVWYYEFSYIGNRSHYENPETEKPTRAAHHDDLIYLFSLGYRFPDVGLEGRDAELVDKMTALWYNFAKNGLEDEQTVYQLCGVDYTKNDPNPRGDVPELAGLAWPAVTPQNHTFLRIDSKFSLHKNLHEDRYKVWEQLFPIQ